MVSSFAGVALVAAAGWHDEAPGGANKLPTDFARFLAERGYAVTYLCPSTAVDRISRERVDGVDLRRYPAPAAPSPSVNNLRHHWRLARRIARAVRSERCVIALLGHAPLQYFAAAAACGTEVRRCYAVHSPFAAELREGAGKSPSFRQRLAWRAAAILERRILAMSDLVHFDSTYTRAMMVSTYPHAIEGKAVVLPGWVDATRFTPATITRDEVRARLGPPWQPGACTFFTLRRLVPRMGLETMIEAAALLAREQCTFRLVIGGDGPERAGLEALAASRGLNDRVTFLGRVPEDRLTDSFRAADCFILPTRALECFGLIVLEAYACGVPVIGVPVGAIPETVGLEFSHWIADDNGAPALARRMADFLAGRITADPDRLRRRALQFEMQAVARLHERMLLGRGEETEEEALLPDSATYHAGMSHAEP